MIAWAVHIFGMLRLNDLPILSHGVFLLLYVPLMFLYQVSHDLKVQTTTTILFDFSMRALASYINIWVKLSLDLLVIYNF